MNEPTAAATAVEVMNAIALASDGDALVDAVGEAMLAGVLVHDAWRKDQEARGFAPHPLTLAQAKGGRPQCIEHVSMDFGRAGYQRKPCPFLVERHDPRMCEWWELTEADQAAFRRMGISIVGQWEKYLAAT